MNHMIQGNNVDFFASYPKETSNDLLLPFLQIFQPTVFVRSDEEYFNIDRFPPPPPKYWVKSRNNLMCMFLNRKNVSELFKKYIEENNVHYDLVISTRIDFLIHSKLNLQLLLQKSNNHFLSIPSGEDWLGINDRIAISNMNTMIEYLSCYNSLEYLFERGTYVYPEIALKDYIDYKKIKVFRFPLKTIIIRK